VKMIKSTVEKNGKYSKYPYVGIEVLRNFVVLFVSPKEGTVLHTDNSSNPVGSYSSVWLEENFEPLIGAICISNV